MVQQLCSLKVEEFMIEEKVTGHDVLVVRVHDEKVFDDHEMTKKSIVVEKEKEFVPVNDDNGEPEGTVKQARKRKRVRKRKTC